MRPDTAGSWTRPRRMTASFAGPAIRESKAGSSLLTVLAHEMGHILGFADGEDGVMAETLIAGVRRLPGLGVSHDVALDLLSCENQEHDVVGITLDDSTLTRDRLGIDPVPRQACPAPALPVATRGLVLRSDNLGIQWVVMP